MAVVIRAEGLTKVYHIGRKRSGSLRETITDQFGSLFSKDVNDPTTFYALDNVSFEVSQGEVIGIIGKNGAGKSTLLKILSRITEPTRGSVILEGRLASLLEVGTGFHPELTGRENIFLNGAILGMKRGEIKNRFDEIVAFSGIEQFIDTPVKRYSSGMYVRLAFSVAAHLDPEILIIDEVLAVGDAEFQKKCLGKMRDVSEKEGRTVLFVSHNMLAVKSLCTNAIFLEHGKLASSGSIEAVMSHYLSKLSVAGKMNMDENDRAANTKDMRLISIEMKSENDTGRFPIDKPFEIVITLINKAVNELLNFNLFFNDATGANVFVTHTDQFSVPVNQSFEVHFVVPANMLNDNIYILGFMAIKQGKHQALHLPELICIEGIEPPRNEGWLGKFPGVIRPKFEWSYRINDGI